MNFWKKAMLAWLVVSFLFWTLYIVTNEMMYRIFYFYFILLVVGPMIWFKKEEIETKLRAWKLNPFAKFIVLGYGTVLFEEVFAALVNHLSEGFSLAVYLQRIGQFWALNTFAFMGFYLAWYFLLKRYRYSHTEVFFVSGFVGLFAEKVIYQLFANPFYVFFMAPLMIFVYGLMITLPMLSLKTQGKKQLKPLGKYVLSVLLIFLFSIFPILALQFLRTNYPWAFPPVELIPM